MSRAIVMTGHQTKHARVVGRASFRNHAAMWVLECVCGSVFRAAGSDVRRRPSMSCGCRGNIALPGDSRDACLVQECRRVSSTRGLCVSCYRHAKRMGVLDGVALPPAKAKAFEGITGEQHPRYKGTSTSGERGYNSMHRRLRQKRGRASEHACAEQCGRAADHWSYDGYCPHEQFGNANDNGKPWCPDLDHYEPRCGPCHGKWDADSDYVADLNQVESDA